MSLLVLTKRVLPGDERRPHPISSALLHSLLKFMCGKNARPADGWTTSGVLARALHFDESLVAAAFLRSKIRLNCCL